MTIGGSIFIIAVGAILFFATNWRISEVDLNTVGLDLVPKDDRPAGSEGF